MLEVTEINADLSSLQARLADRAVFPSPSPYPDACQGASTYIVQRGLSKTCNTPVSGDLGAYGTAYNIFSLNGVSSTVSLTVNVACPDISGAETILSALGQFQQLQLTHARAAPNVTYPPSTSLVEVVSDIVSTLLYQIGT